MATGQGDTHQPANTDPPARLLEARIAKNEEQANYYREKTAALQGDSQKASLRTLLEPASLVQWIGHLIALFSVLFAFGARC